MMSNNKILTVSYGTFSCTLEGFDDSFGTMKAIAEYFRDLASDDRYFGAEPPQPDAEMLARIAQKEISRRVEARHHDGKIHLSAMDDGARAAQSSPVALGQGTLAAPTAAAVAPQVSEDVAQAPVASPAEAAPAPVAEVASAAAEQAEDAAVLMDVPEAAATPDAAFVAEAPAQPVEAKLAEAVVAEEIDEAPEVEGDAFFAASTAAATVDEEIEDDIEDGVHVADAASEVATDVPAPVAAPKDDSIAAKLQRIRAVVAQHDAVEDDSGYDEDEHAQADDVPAAVSDAVTEARSDIEDAMEADDAADMWIDDGDDAENGEDDIAAILGRLEAGNDADESEDLSAEVGDPEADVAEVDVAEAEETNADDSADELADLIAATSDNMFEDKADGSDSPEVASADETVSKVATASDDLQITPRARVIKVKRVDLQAAIASGNLEEYDDTDTAEEKPEAPAPQSSGRNRPSTLSAEQEADLARDLAALEAELGDFEDEAEDMISGEDSIFAEDENDAALFASDEEEAEVEVQIEMEDAAVEADEVAAQSAEASDDETPARSILPSIDDEQSTAVTRLMAESDHQMDEPESATRRNAFAHLRAAVAAKKADVAMGAPAEDGKGDDDYRSDLADVVRPRRPVSSVSRTERPADKRPAPLKLVAAQRIDVDHPRNAGPIRPRRVAAVQDVAPTIEGESFADFAAEMGATKLPELLEAAAAYMSFVEGREQFSRPQLMSKVRQAGPDEGFSREDGLRSFGQLLRAGKIEKIKGGRFTVSEDIGFRPDHRAAG